jgi:hypothetical protein
MSTAAQSQVALSPASTVARRLGDRPELRRPQLVIKYRGTVDPREWIDDIGLCRRAYGHVAQVRSPSSPPVQPPKRAHSHEFGAIAGRDGAHGFVPGGELLAARDLRAAVGAGSLVSSR